MTAFALRCSSDLASAQQVKLLHGCYQTNNKSQQIASAT